MLKPRHQHSLWIGLFYSLSWGATLFFLYWANFVLDQARLYAPAALKGATNIAVSEIVMCALYMLWATWLVLRDLKHARPVVVLTPEQIGALMRLSLVVFVLLSILLCTFLSFAFFASVD